MLNMKSFFVTTYDRLFKYVIRYQFKNLIYFISIIF
uniref:ABC transporter permease n=1 Tax=Heterorhabditis bacteriophora TaxID=37862 RepID=A0A1I7WHE8_HETBA